MLLFKISGLLLVFSAATAIGFLKSNELSVRAKRLDMLCRGLSELKERIRCGEGEIERLVLQSFDRELITAENGKITVNRNGLKSEDVTLLEEYFSDAGMSDIQSECERCRLYISLLKEQHRRAEEDCSKLCRLYRTLGFLSGIFICIFFL